MITYSFNHELMARISKVLDITVAEIARRCNIKQQVLNRYVRGEFVISVQALIEMCNSLRMPIYFFVSENDTHLLPAREEATVLPRNWHPITWDTEEVERCFGDGPRQIYWKDVAAAMDVTDQKAHNRLLLNRRLPTTDFLTACTKLQVSPYRFLIDPNRPNFNHKTKKKATYKGELVEMDKLRRELATMHTILDDLTEKYNQLLNDHRRLAQQVNVNIDTFSNSHLSIAAEPPTGYKFGQKENTRKEK